MDDVAAAPDVRCNNEYSEGHQTALNINMEMFITMFDLPQGVILRCLEKENLRFHSRVEKESSRNLKFFGKLL